jgi:protein-tyrosine phosphatase
MKHASTIVPGLLWSGSRRVVEHPIPDLIEVIVSCLPIGRVPCHDSAHSIRETIGDRLHRIVVCGDHDPLPPEYIAHALDNHDATVRGSRPTLIHCNAGVNRSSTMAACWLVLHQGHTAARAIEQVINTRPEAEMSEAMRDNVVRVAQWCRAQ